VDSCIAYLGRSPSPLEGGQQGSVPGIRGPGWQLCKGGTCLGPLACCQPWAKGPSEGAQLCSRCRHRGGRGGNVPYNCMRESPPPRPHKGIRTLGSRHFEIVKYLESKTGYEILPQSQGGDLTTRSQSSSSISSSLGTSTLAT
jgi:hypothetical protein